LDEKRGSAWKAVLLLKCLTMLSAEEIGAWKAAAEDLGIGIRIEPEAVVVEDFGSKNGMLCAVTSEWQGLRESAERRDMGWSALGDSYLSCDRDLFIDVLNDWGWATVGGAPAWYSGEP
jgi:hypothetical protein